jgi:hypothetical protein
VIVERTDHDAVELPGETFDTGVCYTAFSATPTATS